MIDLIELEVVIIGNIVLVLVMYVNNEIGVVFFIEKIG